MKSLALEENTAAGSSPGFSILKPWHSLNMTLMVDHLCYFCLVFVMLSCVSVY